MNNFFKYWRSKLAFATIPNTSIYRNTHKHYVIDTKLSSHYPIFEHMDYYKSNVAIMVQCLNVLMDETSKYVLVCTGTSGISLAIGVQLSLKRHIGICYIRKANEDNHGHGNKVCGTYDKFIIIDDLVESGRTMEYLSFQLTKTQDHLKVETICASDANRISSRYTELFPNLKYIVR